MDLDYSDDVIIDESALDIEWLNQPKLALKYGEYYAKCKDRVMRTEEALKLTYAILTNAANEDPDNCLGKGIKPTGNNVEAYVRSHARHKREKQDWMNAMSDYTIAEVAYNQIARTRKDSLEQLVKLHMANYFAGPAVPRDLNFEAAKSQVQSRADLGVMKRIKKIT